MCHLCKLTDEQLFDYFSDKTNLGNMIADIGVETEAHDRIIRHSVVLLNRFFGIDKATTNKIVSEKADKFMAETEALMELAKTKELERLRSMNQK